MSPFQTPGYLRKTQRVRSSQSQDLQDVLSSVNVVSQGVREAGTQIGCVHVTLDLDVTETEDGFKLPVIEAVHYKKLSHTISQCFFDPQKRDKDKKRGVISTGLLLTNVGQVSLHR